MAVANSVPSFVFPKCFRVRASRQYQAVFASRFRLKSPCMSIIIRDNKEVSPRLGVVIAKKQVRRAVDRNRLKRVIREHFRTQWRNKLQQHGFALDVVVIVRSGLLRLDKAQLHDYLEQRCRCLINYYKKQRSA